MAQEVGQFGVRVNAICPGLVGTYRMDDIAGTDAYQQMLKTRIPMQRDGRGEEIAFATAYLCSDQGSWITGQSINIDGGMAVQH
jgi:NAD(P)-dependent dehydrogenase (short-subunit alcohol dehydrogenase family)